MLFLINDNGVPSVAKWVRAIAAAPGLPGDFNDDNRVNAADYVVWRNGLGTTYTPADYIDWRKHFGQTAAAGGGIESNLGTEVPEPESLVVLAIAGLLRRARVSLHCRRRDMPLIEGFPASIAGPAIPSTGPMR
jgi:hypothetical protein